MHHKLGYCRALLQLGLVKLADLAPDLLDDLMNDPVARREYVRTGAPARDLEAGRRTIQDRINTERATANAQKPPPTAPAPAAPAAEPAAPKAPAAAQRRGTLPSRLRGGGRQLQTNKLTRLAGKYKLLAGAALLGGGALGYAFSGDNAPRKREA